MKTIQEFKPVCAVLQDAECPGVEFESHDEAMEYCREYEEKYGRNGEDRKFPMIVDYQRNGSDTEYCFPYEISSKGIEFAQ